MKIDLKDIEDAAVSAKIDISKESSSFIQDISSIITKTVESGFLERDAKNWDLLNKTNEEIFDLCYGAGTFTPLREDIVGASLKTAEVLANSPKIEAGCITIPKVLGKEG